MPAVFALAALIGWCGVATWVWMALMSVYRHIHLHEPELAFLIASVFTVIFLIGVVFLGLAVTGAP